MKKYTIVFVLLSSINLYGQTDSSNIHLKWHKNKLSFTAAYQNGYVLPTNIFVKGSNANSVLINDFQSLNIKFATQTTGESTNEQLYNYPSWGIGLKVLNFNNINEIGIPIATYGFIDMPLLRTEKVVINFELGFGISFNWHSFNPVTNQYNIALGAGQAFMSDAGLNFNYGLSEHLYLVGGMNFSHYSNGAIKLPNFGINALAPKLGIKYNFYDRPKYIKKEIPKFKPHGEWLFSTFVGIKNIIFDSVSADITEKYEGVFFPIYGLSALYNQQINRVSKIGIGMTFNFNDAINAQIKVDNNELVDLDVPFYNQLQLSIYPSYEFCVDKVFFLFQPAFYIYRKTSKNQSTTFHQRISVNYQITDNIFAGITLRDFSMHADFVEWTLGYRINRK